MKPGHAAIMATTATESPGEQSSGDSVRRDPEHFDWQCTARHPDHPKIQCQYSKQKKHKVHKHVGINRYYRWEDPDGRQHGTEDLE